MNTHSFYHRVVPVLAALLIAGCTAPEPSGPDPGIWLGNYITEHSGENDVALASGEWVSPVVVNGEDFPGVLRAAADLCSDLEKVTGKKPPLITATATEDWPEDAREMVIIAGSMGNNRLIDKLISEDKVDGDLLSGKWESSVTTLVENPFEGVSHALVIAGSDKRGTIFGIYELSRQIGVSPWHFWADVVPQPRENLYVVPGNYSLREPAVRYRGIFINDEAPALSGWVHERYGGFNHQFYEHVFELILRMKGNYLWPAMWGRAFYDDDSLNAPLANEYGVVIGTTHHEPLMRAHVEWSRYGSGPWDYSRNPEKLRSFWREGMERMDAYESIVSVGMRGDGDAPMTRGTAIELLERIVADQREIIAEVTGKDPAETPQLWALYKEVQDYYDQGMRVPDDVTLLLCDDNWGNIRKLPQPHEPERQGGYGIYYHFDYVGGPRNYKWLNTNQIERVWEQMSLAYTYGANQIWIVNVGDIKPMELPTQFFLDLAWDPGLWNPDNLPEYYDLWATQQFGPEHAKAIGKILALYTKYNARRKPELLSPRTYSLTDYREADRVVHEYSELEEQAEALYAEIPERVKDAYYQLVLFPVKACANLNRLYVEAARNLHYASQGRAATNTTAAEVRRLFEADSLLTAAFHTELAGGKWNHMMSQTHIGYRYWQEPRRNYMPEVMEIRLPGDALMGVALEGSDQAWPGSGEEARLPVFNNLYRQEYFIEVFNRGSNPFKCSIKAGEPWIRISRKKLTVEEQERILVRVRWGRVPEGVQEIPITIESEGQEPVIVTAVIDNREVADVQSMEGDFAQNKGIVSMEAASFHGKTESGNIRWKIVENLGRTGSSVISMPMDAPSSTPAPGSPALEYNFFVRDSGTFTVHCFFSPTLNFLRTEGLRYAVSIDDEPPAVVNLHEEDNPRNWNRWVADNINIRPSVHRIAEPGLHTLRFWRVDPGIVLQKVVILSGNNVLQGYLGPPENKRISP